MSSPDAPRLLAAKPGCWFLGVLAFDRRYSDLVASFGFVPGRMPNHYFRRFDPRRPGDRLAALQAQRLLIDLDMAWEWRPARTARPLLDPPAPSPIKRRKYRHRAQKRKAAKQRRALQFPAAGAAELAESSPRARARAIAAAAGGLTGREV